MSVPTKWRTGPWSPMAQPSTGKLPRGRFILSCDNRLVLVSHSVVRQELFHHRLGILAKLKKLPGCGGIKGLTLRAG